MELNFKDNCGCGDPVKYSTLCGRGSCNKHKRCLSYEEQENLINVLQEEALTYKFYLEKITRVNAMDYEYKSWAKEALDKVIMNKCDREMETYNHNLRMMMED